jgi:hypothetical protein
MLHSDIIPEHCCDGELIQPLAYVHIAWCSAFGTKFTYGLDSDWVTDVLAGNANVIVPLVVAATIDCLPPFDSEHLAGFVSRYPPCYNPVSYLPFWGVPDDR